MTKSDLRLWLLLIAGWAIVISAYCWAFRNPVDLTPF